MSDDIFADYEYLGYCQYGVPNYSCPEGVADCQEPAVAKIWWSGDDEMLVCQEHLDFIIESEREEISRLANIL